MVKLTKIYTRTGDEGLTGLSNFSRVRKTDPRIEAYADVDEANSAIGVAVSLAQNEFDKETLDLLSQIQNDLFDLGAVEDEIAEWFYNSKEKVELNPRLSDYADVDDKEFNKEARSDIKWQMERQ